MSTPSSVAQMTEELKTDIQDSASRDEEHKTDARRRSYRGNGPYEPQTTDDRRG